MKSVCHFPDQREVLYQPSALADPDILDDYWQGRV